MENGVFLKQALGRIRKIHGLSSAYNRLVKKEHPKRLLELMRHHVNEIEELTAQDDPHGTVETGDLAVLCFELILENGRSPDVILNKCFERYEKKLSGLIQHF